MGKNILFISEMLPIDTHASSVVFYRHFKRLTEQGYKVHILTDENSYNRRLKNVEDCFTVHLLPNRKWFYPPYKNRGIFQEIRFYDYFQSYAKKIIREEDISLLVGYVAYKFLSSFTAYVQKKSHLNLISFFHDDPLELHFFNSRNEYYKSAYEILDASKIVLLASDAFKNNWSMFSDKFQLLYPIPEYSSVIKTDINFNLKNKIGYSGTVYNEIVPQLDMISSIFSNLKYEFVIIGNNSKIDYISEKYKGIEIKSFFETSKESNSYLVTNCKMCVIVYPEKIEEMPWVKTCFPSKFIQYCHLGIPTLIIAPKESAIGKWCIDNNWFLYLCEYDAFQIENIILDLLNSKEVLNQVKYFKDNIFNPEIIHYQLEQLITEKI